MRRAGRPPRAAQRSAELRPRRCAAQIEPDFYPKNKLLAAQAFAKLGAMAGAFSGLAMGLTGLITAFLLPLIVAIFGL